MLITIVFIGVLGQSPDLAWNPETIDAELVPGTLQTNNVSLTSSKDLLFNIIPDTNLSTYFHITPAKTINGSDTIVSLIFEVSSDQLPQQINGVLSAELYFLRGNSNTDNEIDISDAIRILLGLFAAQPLLCPDSADVNDDGVIDISDVINLLSYIFLDWTSPPTPYPQVGYDPTEDDLHCAILEQTLNVSLTIAYPSPESINGVTHPTEERITIDPQYGVLVIKDEVIVLFPWSTSAFEAKEIIEATGGILTGGVTEIAMYEARYQGTTLDSLPVISSLINERCPECIIVRANQMTNLAQTEINPDDPETTMYAHNMIETPSAWTITTGKPSTQIAIIDGGYYPKHEDLIDNVVDSDKVPQSDAFGSHGTHVAGIAGARGNNNKGIAGVCWNCSLNLWNRRTFNKDDWDMMVIAAKRNIDVVNISGNDPLGLSTNKKLWESPLQYAEDNHSKTVFVFAAGNDNLEINEINCVYPAILSTHPVYGKRVITVAAVNENGGLSQFPLEGCKTKDRGSNYGDFITVAAPGSNIVSTTHICNGCYIFGLNCDNCPEFAKTYYFYNNKCGTSMAAPFVSGLVGLLRSKEQNISAEDVKKRIIQGACQGNKKVPGHDFYIINALKTLSPDPDLIPSNPGGNTQPSVAFRSNDGFILTWKDGSGLGIRARKASTNIISISNSTNDEYPSVAINPNPSFPSNILGEFVVAWQRNTANHVFARKFDFGFGVPVTDEVKISQGLQKATHPVITMDSNENIFVCLLGNKIIGGVGIDGVEIQKFDKNFNPLWSSYKRLSKIPYSPRRRPSMAINPFGEEIVVVWDNTWNNSLLDVYASLLDKNGNILKEEFLVDSNCMIGLPEVGMDKNGNFTICWAVYKDDGNYEIFAKMYRSDGQVFKDKFRVNDSNHLYSNEPQISMNSDGEFVIGWIGRGNIAHDYYIKRYDKNGNPLGLVECVKCSSVLNNDVYALTDLALDFNGNIVATWEDLDGWGYFAKVFSICE